VILYDPAEDLELPKQPSELLHVILTQEEARRFLDAPDLRSPVGYRDKALLELLYASGVRTAELLRLKVSDIDVKSNIVHVRQGKGRKDRDVPIPSLAMNWVREYIEKVRPAFAKRRRVDDGTLWLNYTGGLLDKNRLVEVFNWYDNELRCQRIPTVFRAFCDRLACTQSQAGGWQNPLEALPRSADACPRLIRIT